MFKILLKPMSANQAWQGRRRRSKLYRQFARDLALLLPKNCDIPEGRVVAYYEFGFSNCGSDWDNPIKQIQDIISKKYGFNDNRIYRGIVDKVITPKGQEYIKFRFESLADNENLYDNNSS